MAWKGTLLDQSLEDDTVLELVDVVDSEEMSLEGEDRTVKLYRFRLEEASESEFVEEAKKCLKPGWYTHIAKEGEEIIAVFKDKSFRIEKGDEKKLEAAKAYGKQKGILEEQLDFQHLLENPWD